VTEGHWWAPGIQPGATRHNNEQKIFKMIDFNTDLIKIYLRHTTFSYVLKTLWNM